MLPIFPFVFVDFKNVINKKTYECNFFNFDQSQTIIPGVNKNSYIIHNSYNIIHNSYNIIHNSYNIIHI